jgi:hypothetical protein
MTTDIATCRATGTHAVGENRSRRSRSPGAQRLHGTIPLSLDVRRVGDSMVTTV